VDDILNLVEEIQAGIRVEENSEKIHRKFRPRIRSFFLNKGFSPQESEDLTQDVFLRVFKSIDTFRRESRFERWLWEIRAHIYSNEIRRRRTEKRDAREHSLDAEMETEEGSSPALVLPSTDLSPEDEVIRSERSEALHEALHKLPDQMRRCCILRYERGLKYQEIATLMGISIETVKAHLHQARKRLMDLLGDNPEKEKGQ
jgi:RNA polymerase sigma-70 factor, ECF subfamily